MFSSIVIKYIFVLSSHKLKQRWKLLLQRTAKHSLFKNIRSFSFSDTSIQLPIYIIHSKQKFCTIVTQFYLYLCVRIKRVSEKSSLCAVIEPRPVHCVRDVPQLALCNSGIDTDNIRQRLIVLPITELQIDRALLLHNHIAYS